MVARACSPSYSGGWGRRIAWTQEAEVAVSRDRHCTPGWVTTVKLRLKKKKKKMLECCLPTQFPLTTGLLRNTLSFLIFISLEKVLTRHLFSPRFSKTETQTGNHKIKSENVGHQNNDVAWLSCLNPFLKVQERTSSLSPCRYIRGNVLSAVGIQSIK